MNTKTTLRANNQKASQDSRRGRGRGLTPYPAREVPAAASKALCDQKIDSQPEKAVQAAEGGTGTVDGRAMTPAEAETFKSSFGSRVRLFERVTVSEPGALSLAMGGENPVESHAALAKAVGSSSHEFMDGFIAEVAGVAYQKVEGELSPAPLNAMLAGIIGAAPKDELEAMLAAQMVATHSAMMAAMRRLAASSNIAQQDSNGNLVTKLSRTYTAQMEALARYRGKGTQRVVVEHVTTNVAVAPGGQANVGVVMAGDRAPGGGEQVEKGGQSHGRR